MPGENRSKLLRMTVRNIGCIGNEGVEIELDNIVCLVGKNNAGKSTILRAYELAKGTASLMSLVTAINMRSKISRRRSF